MKKFLVCAVAYLTLALNLSADITSQLDGYSEVSCTFQKKKTSHKKEIYSSKHTHPHMPIDKGTSVNWSGYAAETDIGHPAPGAVGSVSGSWTVPALQPTADDSYTAIWVGIDGYSSTTVEQLGTEHDWSNGVQQNYAWFEMYPNPSYQIIGFPVEIGDVIAAEVTYRGQDQFQLLIANRTRNVYAQISGDLTKSAVAKRSSAEWIVEAPYSSAVLPLSDFQQVAFTECVATIDDITGGIAHRGRQADAITMESLAGVVKAVPSALTNDAESFTVTWEHE